LRTITGITLITAGIAVIAILIAVARMAIIAD
jgi:hypothetical protein